MSDGLNDVASISELNSIMGYSGIHSSFLPQILEVASLLGIDPRRLIIEVSMYDQVAPSTPLIRMIGDNLLRRYSRSELQPVHLN